MTVTFKVFGSDNKSFKTMRVPTADGDEGLNLACYHLMRILTEQFPDKEWTFVRTRRNQYNVLHKVGQA